jgi:tetratricopeptide (TPR) repeat protein
MAKIGRNEPCPCGSGKKYKKCCEAAQITLVAPGTMRLKPSGWMPVEAGEDPLDQLSNSVVDLIDQGHFDEALAACEHLRVEYPDVVDWLERSAAVHDARGDLHRAREFYQRALDFTNLPEQRERFEDDARDFYRRKLASFDARIAAS